MPAACLLLAACLQVAPGEPAALDLANPRHVRALYLDALGRTPTADEAQLAQASSAGVLVRHLCTSPEFFEHLVEEELYYFLLVDNARPDPDGPEGRLAGRLQRGELGVADGLRALLGSQAFHRANPGNDTWVSVVLEQALGITVQRNRALLEAGKRMYDGRSASLFGSRGDSQADVLRIVTAQPGFLPFFLRRQHQRVVGVAPDAASLASWAHRLEGDPQAYPQLVMGWLLSQAYVQRLTRLRLKSDRQFLRGLHVDLTGAPPQPERLQRLRAALDALADPAPMRSVLARALVSEAEPTLPRRQDVDARSWVRTCFLRYLGREPGDAELEDFGLVFAQEACRPATVVRALVTHPEYQYY